MNITDEKIKTIAIKENCDTENTQNLFALLEKVIGKDEMISLLKDSFDMYEDKVDAYYAELFYVASFEDAQEDRFEYGRGN